MATPLKYSFPDQRFDIKPENLIIHSGKKYFKINYPADASPVFRYGDKLCYPVSISIKKGEDASVDNIFVLETVSKVNDKLGIKIFVRMKLKHDTTAGSADGPLTALFGAIAKADSAMPIKTSNGVVVNLSGLFNDPAMNNVSNKLHKQTSDDLTLNISSTISTNLNSGVSTIITDDTSMTEIYSTLTTNGDTQIDVSIVPAPLRQVNKCRRSSDQGSPASFSSKNEPNVMSNVMVITIIGLTMAAFFPMIYSGLVCIPAGDTNKYYAIHILYLIGALSIVIPLIVRGFKDGDMDAQVWGFGIIGIMLIFFWQFNHLSVKQNLMCNSQMVDNKTISEQFSSFFRSGWKVYVLISIITALMITASSLSYNADVFRALVFTQAALTFAGAYIFRF